LGARAREVRTCAVTGRVQTIGMPKLKYAVVTSALCGLAAAFLPFLSFTDGGSVSYFRLREIPGGTSEIYLTLVGFFVALVVGATATAKPPMLRSQAAVALAGFGWVLVRLRDGFTDLITHGGIGAKLMGLSAIAGVAVAI